MPREIQDRDGLQRYRGNRRWGLLYLAEAHEGVG